IIEAMPNRLEWEITTHSMEVLGLEAITAQLIDLRLFDEYDSYFSQFRLYMPSGYSQTTSLGIPVREFAVDQIAEKLIRSRELRKLIDDLTDKVAPNMQLVGDTVTIYPGLVLKFTMHKG